MERHEADESTRHTSAHHAHDPEERKRRIDEALKAYDTKAPPMIVPAPAAPPAQKHVPKKPKKPAPTPPKPAPTSEKDFILEHAAEALSILKRNEKPPQPNTPPAETIQPTHIDPDAAIPAAIAEIEKEKAAQAAAEQAKKFEVTPAQFVETQIDRRHVYILAGAWLGAVPLAIIVYVLTRSVKPGFINDLITLIEYALGLYGLLGWVPLMVLYMKRRTH